MSVETYTKKLDVKAWAWRLGGLSTDSKTYQARQEECSGKQEQKKIHPGTSITLEPDWADGFDKRAFTYDEYNEHDNFLRDL